MNWPWIDNPMRYKEDTTNGLINGLIARLIHMTLTAGTRAMVSIQTVKTASFEASSLSRPFGQATWQAIYEFFQ